MAPASCDLSPYFGETFMRYLLIPLLLGACGTQDLTNTASASRPGVAALDASGGVEHSVTGTATQRNGPGLEYGTAVAVHSDATGWVWGEGITRIIDLSAYGFTDTGNIEMKPECMRVVGKSAYIGFVVTKTFDARVTQIGDRVVFFVRDGGAGGVDVGRGGPAVVYDRAGAICTTTPPPFPLEPFVGNYVVR
jgi:hypothetical protein